MQTQVKADPKAIQARRKDGQHVVQARKPNQYQLNAAAKWRAQHGLGKVSK